MLSENDAKYEPTKVMHTTKHRKSDIFRVLLVTVVNRTHVILLFVYNLDMQRSAPYSFHK